MTHVYGKWLFPAKSPCHVLHHILSHPSGLTGFTCAGMGSGVPERVGPPASQQRSALGSVRPCLLSALSWLPFCLSLSCRSAQLRQSIDDGCPPRGGTCLIFHLQPASQLFGELSTGPRACTHGPAHHKLLGGCEALHESSHIQHFPQHWFLLCVIDWEEIWEWQAGADATVALPPFCHLALCMRINANIQYVSHTHCHSQEHRNGKSHFSAAEAVIPCCQSLLYCRSWICSCLVLSIDGVEAAAASTGPIMPPHQPALLHFP